MDTFFVILSVVEVQKKIAALAGLSINRITVVAFQIIKANKIFDALLIKYIKTIISWKITKIRTERSKVI